MKKRWDVATAARQRSAGRPPTLDTRQPWLLWSPIRSPGSCVYRKACELGSSVLKRSRTAVLVAIGAFVGATVFHAGASSDPALGTPDTREVTVAGADQRPFPPLEVGLAHALEAQMRGIVPGYRLNPVRSFENVQPDGANYVELVGTAPSLGSVTTTLYRHFDPSELRSAGLAETYDPSVGTFWVGALDDDLTSLYFQSDDGPAIWLGVQSSPGGGPATPLAVVKTLATGIVALPVVQSMAGPR